MAQDFFVKFFEPSFPTVSSAAWYFNFNLESKTERFLDTIDFLVEWRFSFYQFAPSKKAETETPLD
jgi:hypothetical protein